MTSNRQTHRRVREATKVEADKAEESRLDRAVRQMIEVESGRLARPEGGSVEIVDDPDIGGIRRDLGLTQQELAAMLGMPIGTLRNWEQGRRKPSNAGKLVLRLLAEAPGATGETVSGEVDAATMTIGRTELAQAVATAAHLTVGEARIVVETVLDEIATALAHGHSVKLKGFGAFSVARREGGKARHPRTGDIVEVAPRNVPKFMPGKGLKDATN
ncbi:helix-turn-helix domain-containing protein [Nitratireductor mangrovi]|uniref:Helix-turn-helix domain-containing protein n=1 Tax=Nitratireductor mangrovi TaxID=2599600 RepID=A0A5B8KWR2_9HYPH|nr:HU family DNA-binding protein [Nitratireductor mangrovi]QDZ00006.2 helix-turn-helix domain-containing protein [Nitratireductor mangrovi]